MRFGFIGFILVVLLIGGVGVVAYDAGISSGAAEAAISDGATVVYRPAHFSPFGVIVGSLFLFLLIGFVMKAVAFRRWSGSAAGPWGRHGAMGHGWDHDDVPERFRPMLDGWHRRSHEGRGEAGESDRSAAADPEPSRSPSEAVKRTAASAPTAPTPPVVAPAPATPAEPTVAPAPPASAAPAAPPRGAWIWDPSAPPAGAWTWDPNATPPPAPAGPPGPSPSGPVSPPPAEPPR